jgi:hypothetical protein
MRKIGNKFIETRNKIFLVFKLILNFSFLKITEIIIKQGVKIKICVTKKNIGFLKWLIKIVSLRLDLLKP